MKKTFTINGDNFSDFQGFTKEFSSIVLSNKHIWNGNLDAFNDILRGGFGFEDDDDIEIVWKNSINSIKDLGYIETIKKLNEKYEHCHPTNKVSVLQELHKARNNQGPTVFDRIIEIINEHENKNITLKLE
ncbi:barstar family protein [Paenibacillus wynnii]|uniref:barstar family protein n=1 Tax=Paenibacillus wynnii TaxID=268407 RepID=UPI002794C75D|nr:hypothetical protein [Paenibacillus wynnii]MDQ0193257.1 RNAse (barnase) inhibitor barstar [Paenibacillus wynnii]